MNVRGKKGFDFIEAIFGGVAPSPPEASAAASRPEASRRVISPI